MLLGIIKVVNLSDYELFSVYFANTRDKCPEVIDIDSLKILIIEDDEDISKFIQMELEYEGYITDVAFDGREAIKTVETNNYDLALLDILLPNLNGIEVLRRVRKWSSIPIIMLTTKDEITDKVMG